MECVLVVPREELFPRNAPHGLLPFGSGAVEGVPGVAPLEGAPDPPAWGGGEGAPSAAAFEALVLRSGFYVERSYAERTPALKQVIPYAVVVSPEGVLLTRRLTGGAESRLHDKLSIGIGGHVDPEDAGGLAWAERRELRGEEAARRHPLVAATIRELGEELHIQGSVELRSVGILNDDTNPVGAVHVGVVQIATVEGTVAIREEHLLEGRLVTPAQLRQLRAEGANYETWSALLVDRIDELLLRHSTPSPNSVTAVSVPARKVSSVP